MPTRSSDIGTEQESGKREVDMTTRKPEAEAETPAEPTAETETPEPTADVLTGYAEEENTDAVGEATAQTVEAEAFEELLTTARERIDAIDDQLLETLERRIAVAGELLAAKQARRINSRDKLRQEEIITRLSDAAETLNRNQVRELFELFIRLGVEHHRQTIIDGRRP